MGNNKKAKPLLTKDLAFNSVPTTGFEPARLEGTTPSRWHVYQFHHVGFVFSLANIVEFRNFLHALCF